MDIDFARLNVDVRVVGTRAERKEKALKRVLHNAFGAARAGHLLAILGASGAGKSTLVRSLANPVVIKHNPCMADDHMLSWLLCLQCCSWTCWQHSQLPPEVFRSLVKSWSMVNQEWRPSSGVCHAMSSR
jgi:ABC-type cobalamin/Fe3+-siderophores transport system ATPase subunit